MARIYINFGDLAEEKQNEILEIAEEEIRNNEDEMNEIIEMYGEDRVNSIVSERAERKLYEFDFVFNI